MFLIAVSLVSSLLFKLKTNVCTSVYVHTCVQMPEVDIRLLPLLLFTYLSPPGSEQSLSVNVALTA